MKQAAIRWVCRFLVASMALMPFAASAGMISTQDAVTVAAARSQRSQVIGALERLDVSNQLQSLGVDAHAAKARVAAMTDDEASALAGQLDTLPAGGTSFAWAIAAAAVIALFIVYRYK